MLPTVFSFPEIKVFIVQQYRSTFFDASFVFICSEVFSPILTFSQIAFENLNATRSNLRLKAKTHVEKTKSFQKKSF